MDSIDRISAVAEREIRRAANRAAVGGFELEQMLVRIQGALAEQGKQMVLRNVAEQEPSGVQINTSFMSPV